MIPGRPTVLSRLEPWSLGTIDFVLFTKKQSQKGGHGPIAHRHISCFRSHKHTAKENQLYRLSAVKLASSSRIPRSFFLHPQLRAAGLD